MELSLIVIIKTRLQVEVSLIVIISIMLFTTSIPTFPMKESADDSPDQTVDRIKIEYHLYSVRV